MHNQPFSSFDYEHSTHGGRPNDPRRRPLLLGCVIGCCLLVIGVRVAYVQTVVAPRFIDYWKEQVVEEESIPSRDGRIVSRDGVVLAQDESRYDVTIDYRWLQDPPDPRWLRQQVAKRLTRHDRRVPALRATAEREVAVQRSQLISSLAALTDLDEAGVSKRMEAIQKRIETMLASVERNREARREKKSSQQLERTAGWPGVLKLIVDELTTSPDRFSHDPIILKEELQDHLILNDVSLSTVAAIESQPGKFPGVHIRATSSRVYPHGDLASHLIGVRKRRRTDENLEKRYGESGIERAGTELLEGTPGKMRHQLNHRGERLKSEVIEPPQDGQDVMVTIDSRLQKIAEQLLDEQIEPDTYERLPMSLPQGGTLIAMDIWTGDVLAMAASPRPSLSVLVHPSQEEWDRLNSDPRRPLFQRPIQTALPPGSFFHVVTAAAALEGGFSDAEEIVNCGGAIGNGNQYWCRGEHGPLKLEDALARDCHGYFYEMARRMGPEPLCEWAKQFGFGQPTGIDLPGEKAGVLPQPDSPETSWYPGSTMQLAIGQGSLLVTPLQVVRMMAAIANGGYLVTPRVMQPQHENVADSGVADSGDDARTRRISGLNRSTLSAIRNGLERVIFDPQGSGQVAKIEMMTMAGLTAAAEVKGKSAHAWFATYAPAQQPRVAVVVVLEHAAHEETAGRIVRDFVIELLGYGYLRPDRRDSRESNRSTSVRAQPNGLTVFD